jgi:hypothetical protein
MWTRIARAAAQGEVWERPRGKPRERRADLALPAAAPFTLGVWMGGGDVRPWGGAPMSGELTRFYAVGRVA